MNNNKLEVVVVQFDVLVVVQFDVLVWYTLMYWCGTV